MKKWLPAILVIAVVVIGVVVTTQIKKSEPDTKVIAIATLMSHPALDAVQDNLKNNWREKASLMGRMSDM